MQRAYLPEALSWHLRTKCMGNRGSPMPEGKLLEGMGSAQDSRLLTLCIWETLLRNVQLGNWTLGTKYPSISKDPKQGYT